MKSTMRLLVLGATGSVGAAVVDLAVQTGGEVIAFGRSSAKLSTLKGISQCIEFDVQDLEAVERAFRAVRERGFVPSAAVNCFGITHRDSFLSQRIEQWDEVLNVNLKGTWKCIQLEADAMLVGGGGSIVNVGSVAGFRANAWGEAPYIASKHGLLGLTKAAAVELGPLGIRVNAVCPSVVDSQMTRGLGFTDQELAEMAQKHPIGRLVTCNEVAQTALWLCSDGASGINGAIIPVDGGLTAK